MTWAYRIAKQKNLAGRTHYQLVEAFMNNEGEIWGHTGHLDMLTHIQYEYDDDEQVRDDILTLFLSMLKDIEEPFIDIDTIEYAESDFEDELEAIKSDN